MGILWSAILLYTIAGMLPPVATRIVRILGIVLAIIGIILIVLSDVEVAFVLALSL